MDQQPPTGGDTLPPLADVRPGRPIAMGAVDVHHGHWTVDGGQRLGAVRAQMADAGGHAGAGEVGDEGGVIVVRFVGVAVELLRAAVVACMWVDRDDLHPVRRGAREHDRAASTEATDLHDAVTHRRGGGGAVQLGGLVGRHPALHAVDHGHGLVEGPHGTHRT